MSIIPKFIISLINKLKALPRKLISKKGQDFHEKLIYNIEKRLYKVVSQHEL